MANNKIDLSAGMVPRAVAGLPGAVRRNIAATGMKIVPGQPAVGAEGRAAIAGVDPDHPNTLVVHDPVRFAASAPQTIAHESTHSWQENLPPAIQANIPGDDPGDPYSITPHELQSMRASGKTLLDLPREQQATLVQYYVSQGGTSAPRSIRDTYEPWVNDMAKQPLSTILPTAPGEEGIETTARPPQGQMYSTQTFAKGDPAPGQKPTHEAGEVTAWDSASGLPIVKRKPAQPASQPSAPDEKEESAEPAGGTNRTKPEPSSPAAAKPSDSKEPNSGLKADKSADTSPPVKGAPVKLQNGTTGKIAWYDPKLGIARIKTDDGKSVPVRKGAFTVQPHTQVAAHVRRIPAK